MAKNNRKELERIISIIKEWNKDINPARIEWCFTILDQLDVTRDADLWDEVRKALATNPDLQDKGIRFDVAAPGLVRKDKSNWWWNPKNWKEGK